jgi:arsenate reductase
MPSGASLTIFHNPACSTSRHALALLQERGRAPRIVEYLKTPPSEAELEAVLTKMKAEPDAILRTRNAPEKALKAWENAKSRKAKIAALHAHPVLIERPIVVAGSKAALVRPKADAEAILDALGA